MPHLRDFWNSSSGRAQARARVVMLHDQGEKQSNIVYNSTHCSPVESSVLFLMRRSKTEESIVTGYGSSLKGNGDVLFQASAGCSSDSNLHVSLEDIIGVMKSNRNSVEHVPSNVGTFLKLDN